MENSTAIQTFVNEEFGELNIIIINAIPWFIGKTLVKILGYKNGSRDIERHVDKKGKQSLVDRK